jgi:hypothetical protein
MKKILLGFLLLAMVFVMNVDAKKGGSSTQSAENANKEWLEKIDLKKAKVTLTLQELLDLKTEAEYKSAKYLFKASQYAVPKMKESQIKSFQRKGEAPFRICADLYEHQGKKKKMMNGRLSIFVFNKEGQMVDTSKESLSKMCPT